MNTHRIATSRRSRGAMRSHSPVRYEYGRAIRAAIFSRRSLSALMIDASRTLRRDVEGELLGAAGHLGDGALGDVLEAIDLLQLGGDLVDRRAGVGRPLDEGLL